MFFGDWYHQLSTIHPSGSAVAHGGNPQDPYGFASHLRRETRLQCWTHRAASPIATLGQKINSYMPTTWTRHHILSLADFTTDEYNTVLQTAFSFQEVLSRRTKKVPTLQGQVVANLFFEPSTRTRSSFELAAKRLSADTLNFASASSSITKGETILDTAKTYLAMGTDIMVIRHREAGVPQAIAQEMDRLGVRVSVLNAGDGQHEHPSQALLDLFTICTLLDPDRPRIELLKDKKIAIVGDILHSRVARSNIWSLIATGAEVHLAAPPTLLPKLFAQYISDEDEERGRWGDV